MSDFNIPYQDSKRAESILNRLADVLGCSTESFSDPQSGEHGQTMEYMRLWLLIDAEQDRAKVLAFLRSMTAKPMTSGEPVALSHAMQKPE